MSMFKEYARKRRLREGLADDADPTSGFKFNNSGDEDVADDHEHTQQELFKVIMTKYPEETNAFLNGIAQRGDEEVAALLRKVGKNKGFSMNREPQHPTDGDEVVPSNADTGHSGGGGEE